MRCTFLHWWIYLKHYICSSDMSAWAVSYFLRTNCSKVATGMGKFLVIAKRLSNCALTIMALRILVLVWVIFILPDSTDVMCVINIQQRWNFIYTMNHSRIQKAMTPIWTLWHARLSLSIWVLMSVIIVRRDWTDVRHVNILWTTKIVNFILPFPPVNICPSKLETFVSPMQCNSL